MVNARLEVNVKYLTNICKTVADAVDFCGNLWPIGMPTIENNGHECLDQRILFLRISITTCNIMTRNQETEIKNKANTRNFSSNIHRLKGSKVKCLVPGCGRLIK